MPPKKSKPANDLAGTQQGVRRSERKRKAPSDNATEDDFNSEAPAKKRQKKSTSEVPPPATANTPPAARTSRKKRSSRQASASRSNKTQSNSSKSDKDDTNDSTKPKSSKYGIWSYEHQIAKPIQTLEDQMKALVKASIDTAATQPDDYNPSAPRRSGRDTTKSKKRSADETASSEPAVKKQKTNPTANSGGSGSRSRGRPNSSHPPSSRRRPTNQRAGSESNVSFHTTATSPEENLLSHDDNVDSSVQRETEDQNKSSSLSSSEPKATSGKEDIFTAATEHPARQPLSPIMESPRSSHSGPEDQTTQPLSQNPPPTEGKSQPSATASGEHKSGDKLPSQPTSANPSHHPSTTADPKASNDDLIAQAVHNALPHVEADLLERAEPSSSSRNRHRRSGFESGPHHSSARNSGGHRDTELLNRFYLDAEAAADSHANPSSNGRASGPLYTPEELEVIRQDLLRQMQAQVPGPMRDFDNSWADELQRQDREKAAKKRQHQPDHDEAASKRRSRPRLPSPADPEGWELAKRNHWDNSEIPRPPIKTGFWVPPKPGDPNFNAADYEGPQFLNRKVKSSQWQLPSYYSPAQPSKIPKSTDAYWQLSHRLPDPNSSENMKPKNEILQGSIQRTSVPNGSKEKPHHDVRAGEQLDAFVSAWDWSHLSRDPRNADIAETIHGLYEEFKEAKKELSRSKTQRRNMGSMVRAEVAATGVQLAMRLERTQMNGDEEELLIDIREWCKKAEDIRTLLPEFATGFKKWND